MAVNSLFVCFVILPCLAMGQLPYVHPGQYGPPVNNDMYQQQMQQPQLSMQQQQQQQQMQLPMQQQQQQQQQPQQPQQLPINQQQQPQQPQQQAQLPMHHQQQQQPYQMSQQEQQRQPSVYAQQQQQQQPYYQGNMQGAVNPSPQGMQPPPLANQFQQPTQDHPGAQSPSIGAGPSERYLVGNLSEPFTFQVAPPSIRVTHLGLNGYSLYIIGVGFSNKSKFNYDEQNNRLTILSLDQATVGYYTAVDGNWQTFVNILSAINVSSLEIRNAHVSEDNNGTALVSCSVSIVRSTYKLAEPPALSNRLAIGLPSSLPSPSQPSSSLSGTENLPRLELFLSTRTSASSNLPNTKSFNDTLNEQVFTRSITLRRPLTRADHNGTVQCQVESNNNIDVFLTKAAPIDIDYGPNLEAGAASVANFNSEVLKMIVMDCQIEANPPPSYVWYEMPSINNTSAGMMPYYGHQIPYGQQQYPLPGMPSPNIPTAALNVFGTTRQIQRIYQNPGQHAMQCQAQSGGKTVKQQFIITVHPAANAMRTGSGSDGTRGKSYKVPMIIGLVVGSVLLLLLALIIVATLIFLKRRKANAEGKHSPSAERSPPTKPPGNAWGQPGIPANNQARKYKREVLKGDSSSTSHLVDSAESNHNHPPPIPSRPSPMTSTHSSYRQPPVPIAFSYQQAATLNGHRAPPPIRSYSPEQDDPDEIEISVHGPPPGVNRSRTTTPFGSRKSLTESIQSLRSNQQSALSLPMKKRSQDSAPQIPQRPASPKSFEGRKDYPQHHSHNPGQLRTQQRRQAPKEASSDEEMEQLNQATEDSAPAEPSTTPGRRPVEQLHVRRGMTPPPPQKIAVHQPSTSHHDDVPPPYQQAAKPVAPPTSFTYKEPTEV